MNDLTKNACLKHHGILGMKWGVRRYQPYGHGGYDPEYTKGRYTGEKTKAGIKKGTIGGSTKNARFDKVKYTEKVVKRAASKTKNSRSDSSGRREDNEAYKYNKPGESGWVGLGRAIKAKTSSRNHERRAN